MKYSFTEILAIEQVLNKAIGAAKAFADSETTKKLNDAAHIFAELRHAVGSAEGTYQEARDAVAQDFFSLFLGSNT